MKFFAVILSVVKVMYFNRNIPVKNKVKMFSMFDGVTTYHNPLCAHLSTIQHMIESL